MVVLFANFVLVLIFYTNILPNHNHNVGFEEILHIRLS